MTSMYMLKSMYETGEYELLYVSVASLISSPFGQVKCNYSLKLLGLCIMYIYQIMLKLSLLFLLVTFASLQIYRNRPVKIIPHSLYPCVCQWSVGTLVLQPRKTSVDYKFVLVRTNIFLRLHNCMMINASTSIYCRFICYT